MISNSLPSGSAPYSDLLTPWSHAPPSAPLRRQQLGGRGQIVDRRDLPGEVVQADRAARRARRVRSDREQAEVVVVVAARRAQEDGPAPKALLDDLEAEDPAVELGRAVASRTYSTAWLRRATGMLIAEVYDRPPLGSHRAASGQAPPAPLDAEPDHATGPANGQSRRPDTT